MAERDIMIVDDNPANLKLLEDMLVQQGHEVRSFPLGRLALAAAAKHQPDLILLDVNMPEMDGYEVCGRLKAIQELAGIPVIFLSALNETRDKVKAFKSGAVDFISKPFQFEEVNARVETHLELHKLQRALKLQNEHLEEIVSARTKELAAANLRLTLLDQAKTDFLNLISHELRTPLNGILGVSELILEEIASTGKNSTLEGLFQRSRLRLISLLDDAILLTQIDVSGEQFSSSPVALGALLNQAINSTRAFAETRHVKLLGLPFDPGMVAGDKALLIRAFEALIQTAVKFSEKDQTVTVTSEVTDNSAVVVIKSLGRKIPASALPKFFGTFAVGEAISPGGDLGLSPPLAHRIVSLFGGSVGVANEDPAGITLTITLKTLPDETPVLDPRSREYVVEDSYCR